MAYCHTSCRNHKNYTVIKVPFTTQKSTIDFTKRIILKEKGPAIKMNGAYLITHYVLPNPYD